MKEGSLACPVPRHELGVTADRPWYVEVNLHIVGGWKVQIELSGP